MLLPEELVDHIFSFLREDISALKSCSKAHPSYSRLAERHLYINILVPLFDPPVVSQLYDQLTNNPCILCYPRTLKIFGHTPHIVYPMALSIISMIPRMVNLVSLDLSGRIYPIGHYEEFISTLRDSLHQSSIERLCICGLDFPLSILNTSKNIKCLRLFACSANEEKPMPDSFLLQALESLVITGAYDVDILFWATHRATRLTSLELRDLVDHDDWAALPELLAASSDSLTSLHLDVGTECQSTYSYHPVGRWLDDDVNFPFTLSSNICLKKVTITAEIHSFSEDVIEIRSSLPAIIQLLKTAPSIQHIILDISYKVSRAGIPFIGRLDWSPLGHLKSPRIDLYVSGDTKSYPVSDESIVGALAADEVLMDLVNRDVVNLESGYYLQHEGSDRFS